MCQITPLEILYDDGEFIAVNKPSGMVTHPSPEHPDAADVMSQLRNHLGCWVYPIHRLDRPTSGILLLTRSQEAAAVGGQMMQNHAFQKTYVAVVRGWVMGDGVIDKPTRKPDTGVRQNALTHYRPLHRWEMPWAVRPYATARYTLMELQPHTGRTHQLRQHMASLSHPIIGDTVYGDGAHNQAFRERLSSHRLLLHARTIQFQHPETHQMTVIHASAHPEFICLFDQI